MKHLYFIFFVICSLISQPAISQQPCVNADFEATTPGLYNGAANATAISGWSISSMNQSDGNCSAGSFTAGSPEAWIVSTPITSITGIGTLPNSPLGGTNILQLNDVNGNGTKTKASQSFPVTNNNTIFQFAFAAALSDNGHPCCIATEFKVELYDCQGNLVTCNSLVFHPTSACGFPMYGVDTYSMATIAGTEVFYTNWQVKYIDLTAYIGTCVTVVFTVRDCTGSGHFGFAYIDAQCGTQMAGTAINDVVASSSAVSFCGSNQAVIDAPAGYSSYQWASQTGNITGATGQSYTVTAPAVGDVYRVALTPTAGCTEVVTYTLVNTTVNISNAISAPSCNQGATGSATVLASGSAIGYNYTWVDASNATVGTSSVLSNAPPGVYTASVSATGCGAATTTVSIEETHQSVIQQTVSFCGTYAYLSAPTAGSGFRWYHGSSIIPGAAGSSYTINTAVNGEAYWLSYQNNLGCRDSVQSILTQTTTGQLDVSYIGAACPGSNTVSVLIGLSNTGTSGSTNFFYLNSVGNTPAYSSSLTATSSLTYTTNGLSTTGVYTVLASDGVCLYGETFTIMPSVPPFTYSLSQPSSTLCPGQNLVVSININNPLGYTYSWAPNASVSNAGGQSFIISQTVPTGSVSNTIYTITVMPAFANCPQTQTLSVTFANPSAPGISSVPLLCSNVPGYTVSVNPTGGVFSTASGTSAVIGQTSGIISPSLAGTGNHSFIYTVFTSTCPASSTGTYTVYPAPLVTVFGSDLICAGETATLLASGADSYLWNTSATGASVSVSPANTTTYTVVGTSSATTCFAAKIKTVAVDPCTGIQTHVAANDLKIYPNPVVNELTIETSGPVSVTIYNELGSVVLVKSLQQGKSTIDLSPFSNGVYLLKANDADGTRITKIVKSH